jgi:predicted transcriptional regulator
MQTLWAADEPQTPAQVQAALGGDLAYNTVQTILIRLLDKGMVQRRAVGRGHAYWPVNDAATVAANRMRAVLDGPGDRQAVLRRFVGELDESDAEILRALLRRTGGDDTP